MKLYPNQLAKHLQSSLLPIYFISGDETLLVQEARDQILAKARKQGFSGHEFHSVNKDFAWQSLYAATHSLSLFDDKSVIELRMQSAKPGTLGAKTLAEYAKQPMSDKLLLIITPKVDSATTRSKWYKALDDAGATIPVWPIDKPHLPKWVAARLDQAGLKTDAAGIKVLISATEGNLLATAQEIEKLRLLYGEGPLSSQQIVTAIADNARFDVFNLVDTIHQGQPASVLRVLSRLRQEGCEPTLMLWALSREARLLASIKLALTQGEPVATAMKKNGVWQTRQSLVTQSLKRHNPSNLESFLRHAGEIDQTIKGLRKAHVWDELTRLAIHMTGVSL